MHKKVKWPGQERARSDGRKAMYGIKLFHVVQGVLLLYILLVGESEEPVRMSACGSLAD